MKTRDIIKNLQQQGVRMLWDEEKEQWYMAAADVVRILTESRNPVAYWRSLKKKLNKEGEKGNESFHFLLLPGRGGKKRRMAVIDFTQFFLLIQWIRTPQTFVWKEWLAMAGTEQIRETYDPERGLDRALDNWRKMGRDEKWILQRMMSQETRNKLTRYWGAHDIRESDEYRSLTNLIHEGWSDRTVQEHKELKALNSQNLRDHMTEAELIFMALAEMAVRQVAESKNATGYDENASSAKIGAGIAGDARKKLENYIDKKIVSGENFKADRHVTEETPLVKRKKRKG